MAAKLASVRSATNERQCARVPRTAQISDETSVLATIGRDLCQQIEQRTHIPTFYYLYRLGRDEGEYQRKCPCCGGEWKLTEPLHDIFHFRCDPCRLISNLSWELL